MFRTNGFTSLTDDFNRVWPRQRPFEGSQTCNVWIVRHYVSPAAEIESRRVCDAHYHISQSGGFTSGYLLIAPLA